MCLHIEVIRILELVGDRKRKVLMIKEALSLDPAVLQRPAFRNFPDALRYILRHFLQTVIGICQYPLVAHSTYVSAYTSITKFY